MIIFVFKSIHQKCTNDMNCKKTIYQYAIILNVKKIDRCTVYIYLSMLLLNCSMD